MAVGAAVVGRVAVKVIPDTRDFGRDLYRHLRRIEQRAEVRVKAVLSNTSTLEREVLEKVREINAMNRLKDSRHIRIHVKSDFSDVDKQVRDVSKHLSTSEASRVQVKTEISEEDIERQIRKITLDATRIKTSIDVDFDVSRERIRDVKDKIEDGLDNVKAEVEPEVAEGPYRAAQARLALLARSRIVQLIPVVSRPAALAAGATLSRLSGARLLGNYIERMWRQIKELDKRIPTITVLTKAFTLLSGWVLTAASNIITLTGSMAQMGLAALALPGILGGFAFGIGATIAVLRDFNQVFPDFQGKMAKLQDQMSAAFWEKAAEPIQHLIDVLFPQFERGLIRTSKSLAVFFGSLADGLANRLDGHIDYMFDNLNRSIEIASRGMDSFAQSLTVLGKVGSEYLPRLAEWFVRINDSFAKWVTAAQDDGRLNAWIETGIEQIGHFGRALANTGRILRNLFQISEAAGGSTLSMFADTLGRIAEVTGREPFRSKLIFVLRSAHEMMSLIANQSGPALSRFFTVFADTLGTVFVMTGDAVGKVLGGIADALAHPAFQSGLVAMFQGMSDGIKSMIPALQPLARGFGGLARVIGAMAQSFGPALASMFGTIGGVMERLAPALVPIIRLLGSAFTDVLEAAAPAAIMFASAFADLLRGGGMTALRTILPPIVDLLSTMAQEFGNNTSLMDTFGRILPPLAEGFAKIVESAIPLVPLFSQLLQSVLVPMAPVLAQFAEWFFPALGDAVAKLAPPLGELLRILTQVLAALMPIILPITSFIRDFLADTLITLIEGIAQAVQGAVDIIKGIWDAFAGIFTMDADRFWSGIAQIAKGAWDLIVGIIKVVLSVTIFKIAKLALVALKGLFKLGWNAISSGARAVWNAISSFFSGFMSTLRSKASSGINAVKNLLSTGAQGARKLVIQAFQRLRDGAINILNNLRTRVASIKDRVLAVFRNVGNWLYNSGRALIRGFIDGIKSLAGAAKDAAGSLLSGVRNLFPFSPAKEGPFSGKGWTLYSGQAIAEDLAKGMRQRLALAKQAAEILAESAYPSIEQPRLPESFGDGGPDDNYGGGAVIVQQTINNPLPEEPSEATNKGLQTAAALGLV